MEDKQGTDNFNIRFLLQDADGLCTVQWNMGVRSAKCGK